MDIVIPKPVNEVLNILYENDYEGYLVGGAVRNMVMGQKPRNYNISTNASLTNVEKALKSYNTFYCGQNNSSLGIVNAKFPMEITKYRTPENTLESDLATRDFTMNALAYSDEDGLIDYNTGVLDIKNKIIRVNGEEDEIFINDPLRILRAIRLSAEYGMRIDPQTQEYMFDNKDLLKDIAPERIRDELSKLLVTPRADFYIKKYFDIFLTFLPELSLLEKFSQNQPQHIYDALEHTLVTVKSVETNLELRLAMLFHDVAKPFTFTKDDKGLGHFKDHQIKSAEMARNILNRLKFNKRQIQKVTKLIEYHDYKLPEQPEQLKTFIAKFGPDDIEDLLKVKKANFYGKNPAFVSELTKINEEQELIQSILKKKSFIKRNELKITGRDLLNAGIKQEIIGGVLEKIYQKIINGELKNNYEKLLEYTINNLELLS